MSAENLGWFDNVENRSHPWPGLNWLTTAIVCPDVRKAVEFYQRALLFVPIFELPGENGELQFARMRYRGSNFTLNKPGFDFDASAPAESGQTAPFVFYVYVDDAKASAARMIDHGATEIFAARPEFWGDLRARVKDPFGYVWDLAQRIQ